jgi:hypothetical protein
MPHLFLSRNIEDGNARSGRRSAAAATGSSASVQQRYPPRGGSPARPQPITAAVSKRVGSASHSKAGRQSSRAAATSPSDHAGQQQQQQQQQRVLTKSVKPSRSGDISRASMIAVQCPERLWAVLAHGAQLTKMPRAQLTKMPHH